MKRIPLAAMLAGFMLCAAAPAGADTALGKVETVYIAMAQNMLIEATPGVRIHDRPLVADVRLRDASGAPARRVFLRLEGETVETGDIVAVKEGERGNGFRAAPLRARDRLARVEARADSEMARNFFNEAPKLFALKRAD